MKMRGKLLNFGFAKCAASLSIQTMVTLQNNLTGRSATMKIFIKQNV